MVVNEINYIFSTYFCKYVQKFNCFSIKKGGGKVGLRLVSEQKVT
jgi:hypothetical protein